MCLINEFFSDLAFFYAKYQFRDKTELKFEELNSYKYSEKMNNAMTEVLSYLRLRSVVKYYEKINLRLKCRLSSPFVCQIWLRQCNDCVKSAKTALSVFVMGKRKRQNGRQTTTLWVRSTLGPNF